MRRDLRAVSGFVVRLYNKVFTSFALPTTRRLSFLSGGYAAGGVCSSRLSLSSQFVSNSISKPAFFESLTISTNEKGDISDDDDQIGSDSTDNDGEVVRRISSEACSSSVFCTVLEILQVPCARLRSEKLELCTVSVTHELVEQVLSRTRNNWEAAFTFFLWAGKQPGFRHILRDYHSMIAILGKFRKFDTAWRLIDDMKALSIVTPRTLMIMIRKYAAVHDVAKAINAFYGLRRYNFDIGIAEFQGLLSALSRYKNIKDAEYMLFCNKSVFPLCTKSFNIILNGWCNVVGDLREGRRIWKEMERRRIQPDVYSYSSIISCCSKKNGLKSVMKLYENMKACGIDPDKKVYNALIHALSKVKLLNEAYGLMKTMEEKGIPPDSVSYNSLIMPLCKHRLLDEAKQAFDEMMQRGLLPSIRTYHAFFRVLRSGEEVLKLLQTMHDTGCHPCHDTYIMLIRKFCRWRQLDDAFKLWNDMPKKGLDPDRSSYVVLIHGLFLNGMLEEAHKYYEEMKEKDLLPEPMTDAMIQRWLAGKTDEMNPETIIYRDKRRANPESENMETHFLQNHELSVTRARGHSFWDQ